MGRRKQWIKGHGGWPSSHCETLDQKDTWYVSCSRWAKIQETIEHYARMAALLGAPTVFRLLADPGRMAGPQQSSVSEQGPEYASEDLIIAQAAIRNASLGGDTTG